MVEGARLESVCRGNSTEGSNPSISAIRLRSRVSRELRRDARRSPGEGGLFSLALSYG